MQLPHHPLLFGRRQPMEAGVVTQHPLLLLDGQIAVLVEPVAQVARRQIRGRCIAPNRGTGKARPQIGRTGIRGGWAGGTSRGVAVRRTLWSVGWRAAVKLRSRPALVLRSRPALVLWPRRVSGGRGGVCSWRGC